jgi:hypothetical protein
MHALDVFLCDLINAKPAEGGKNVRPQDDAVELCRRRLELAIDVGLKPSVGKLADSWGRARLCTQRCRG